MVVVETLLRFKWIILFYLVIILFLYWKRKNVATQAKIIFLYRTKIGLRLMERISSRHTEAVKLFGQIGIGVGFVGMAVISVLLVYGLIQLVLRPDAAPGATLVLPGLNIPGIGVLPFWFWLISIFIIAVVHEFSHGVVARAHKIPVKNTGLVLLGPIIGAFVEPDEKKMTKQSDMVQYSVYAAGAWSNILLALVALLLLNFLLTPLQGVFVEDTGFSFSDYVDESLPAAQAGVPLSTVITSVDGTPVAQFQDVQLDIWCKAPGEEISLGTEDNSYTFLVAEHPQLPRRGYLGISGVKNELQLKERYAAPAWKALYSTIVWFKDLAFWVYLLSLGIGLFNLLPLPIVDGGRMAQVAMQKLYGDKKGNSKFGKIALFFLIVLVLSLVGPYILKLF